MNSVVYGCMGISLALYSNAVRKLPLMRRPWEHVLYFGVGAFVGSHVQGYKEEQRAGLAKTLAERKAMTDARDIRIAAKRAAAAATADAAE